MQIVYIYLFVILATIRNLYTCTEVMRVYGIHSKTISISVMQPYGIYIAACFYANLE